MTFKAKKPLSISRVAGTTVELVINVPAVLTVSPTATVKFGIFDNKIKSIEKETGYGITIAGQTITILIAAGESANKLGFMRWQLSIEQGGATHMIGYGDWEWEWNGLV